MKCPNCTTTALVMTERLGVEIDYCPSCRGIWLDRGELDKLLDKAAANAQATHFNHPKSKSAQKLDFEDSDLRRGNPYFRNRKKSWLHDFFD